jgi:uncharacterized DUF497 family protein
VCFGFGFLAEKRAKAVVFLSVLVRKSKWKKKVGERWKKIGKSNDKRVILVDQYVFRY